MVASSHSFLPRAHSLWPAERVPQQEVDRLAGRMDVPYVCPRGHTFNVTFADDVPDAQIPLVWSCRQHGVDSKQFGHEDTAPPQMPYHERRRDADGRTHYDRLLERRSRRQLDALLRERLALLGCREIDALPAPAPPDGRAVRGR